MFSSLSESSLMPLSDQSLHPFLNHTPKFYHHRLIFHGFECRISGVTQYVFWVCVWLLSTQLVFRFVHGVARTSAPLYLAVSSWWTFGALWTRLLWTSLCHLFCGHMHSFILGKYLDMKLLGHKRTFEVNYFGRLNKDKFFVIWKFVLSS